MALSTHFNPAFAAPQISAPTRAARPGSFACIDASDSYAGSCDGNHGVYSRMQFAQSKTLHLPGSFQSRRHDIGAPSSQTDKDWSHNLGEVPKDCYYCAATGKCAQDTPEWGSGKDYFGKDCNACSGKGVCPRCGGDGVIGKPQTTPYGNA